MTYLMVERGDEVKVFAILILKCKFSLIGQANVSIFAHSKRRRVNHIKKIPMGRPKQRHD